MDFQFNDISIHLMPADDKEKDKDKKDKKDKDPGPVDPMVVPGDDDHVHGCTQQSGIGTAKRRTEAGDWMQGLSVLQAQLRSTLSPPPL